MASAFDGLSRRDNLGFSVSLGLRFTSDGASLRFFLERVERYSEVPE
jgi:hypothetical protein